jgi:hypothetical protein
MLSRMRAWFLLGASVLALGAGCKARETAGQDSRPLPTPEPPASPSAALPREEAPAAPKKRAAEEGAKEAPTKPARSPTDAPVAPAATAGAAASAPTTTGGATAAATGGAANTAVPPLPPAPTFTPPSAACLARCQGAMQGCLSAPVDGGVPGFANLDLCKKAFEACQAACK